MSTFRGVIKEFPEIRIDYFRTIQDQQPPLACFLSHVHSDHLQGLESLKAPFVYCSAATKEILLRLEKYPHRMNFAKSILESRKQTYKHLRNLLKTVPLETPTTVELSPGNELRVTLFDANHCVGAVMFLIQGGGKAILYTGDIRSEPWWVNSLIQNPVLIPYALGPHRLDTIYLDTTFATSAEPYRTFPSKAAGLRELLEKVSQYPSTTTFRFEAWTFGYENVWIALSTFLDARVHLDPYRYRLYTSLAGPDAATTQQPREAPVLCGFQLENHRRDGCLTRDPKARIHSCERGTACTAMDGRNDHIVQIVPIITRLETGAEIPELGAAGGIGDLDQVHELETGDAAAVGRLMALCAAKIKEPEVLGSVLALLTDALDGEQRGIRLDPGLDEEAAHGMDIVEDMPLQELVDVLARIAETRNQRHSRLSQHALVQPSTARRTEIHPPVPLPRTITFPYSRHSSYDELCALVRAFRPHDVYPCTMDEAAWTPATGMRALFGHLCSGDTFAHDAEMLEKVGEREEEWGGKRSREGSAEGEETQRSASRQGEGEGDGTDEVSQGEGWHTAPVGSELGVDAVAEASQAPNAPDGTASRVRMQDESKNRGVHLLDHRSAREEGNLSPTAHKSIGEWAYECAAGLNGLAWADFGGLTCTRSIDEAREIEL